MYFYIQKLVSTNSWSYIKILLSNWDGVMTLNINPKLDLTTFTYLNKYGVPIYTIFKSSLGFSAMCSTLSIDRLTFLM
jgi:hypothetical protein